jgi:hypothetical protein
VRAPGLADADISLVKYITFSEAHHRSLQIKFEVFNVTNTPFFSAPDMSLGSSSFGVISSTNGSAQGTPGFFGACPRPMQVGLKLNL